MATSVFIARLAGPVFLALGLGLLVNPGCYREITGEVLRSKALILYAGLLALPAGLAIVLTHNVWVADWRVVITLLGWLMIASGAAPHRRAGAGRGHGRLEDQQSHPSENRRRDLARGRCAALLLRLSSLNSLTRPTWEQDDEHPRPEHGDA